MSTQLVDGPIAAALDEAEPQRYGKDEGFLQELRARVLALPRVERPPGARPARDVREDRRAVRVAGGVLSPARLRRGVGLAGACRSPCRWPGDRGHRLQRAARRLARLVLDEPGT